MHYSNNKDCLENKFSRPRSGVFTLPRIDPPCTCPEEKPDCCREKTCPKCGRTSHLVDLDKHCPFCTSTPSTPETSWEEKQCGVCKDKDYCKLGQLCPCDSHKQEAGLEWLELFPLCVGDVFTKNNKDIVFDFIRALLSTAHQRGREEALRDLMIETLGIRTAEDADEFRAWIKEQLKAHTKVI